MNQQSNNRLKIISLLIALSLLVSMTGCKKDAEASESSEQTTVQTTASSTESTQTEEETVPSSSGTEPSSDPDEGSEETEDSGSETDESSDSQESFETTSSGSSSSSSGSSSSYSSSDSSGSYSSSDSSDSSDSSSSDDMSADVSSDGGGSAEAGADIPVIDDGGTSEPSEESAAADPGGSGSGSESGEQGGDDPVPEPPTDDPHYGETSAALSLVQQTGGDYGWTVVYFNQGFGTGERANVYSIYICAEIRQGSDGQYHRVDCVIGGQPVVWWCVRSTGSNVTTDTARDMNTSIDTVINYLRSYGIPGQT